VGRIVYTAQAIVENAAEKVCWMVGWKETAATGCRHLLLVPSPSAPAPTSHPPQYPFGGLPNFPEAYPILLSGLSQTNASAGDSVTGACRGEVLQGRRAPQLLVAPLLL
jgi:hypothetical protein